MNIISVFKNAESEARYMAAYDRVLRRWPVTYETIELSTRFGITHILASGSQNASPLLLVPGNFDCSLSWFHIIKSLSAAHRVYALDTIGDVGKSKSCQLPASREDYAEWLKDVLDGLSISTADFMGISYGGFLAVNFALQFQERVKRLVLLCPGLPLAPFTFQWIVRGMPMILRPSEATVKWFIRGASTSKGIDELMSLFLLGMAGARSTNVLRPVIQEEEWKHLQQPILILVGDHEIMYEPGHAIQQARQRMPHIRAEVIRDAGHFLLADQPEQVSQTVLAFLDSPAG